MKKTLIGLLMMTVMLLSLTAPLITTVSAADADTWYKTVSGVLGSDYYALYPYEKANLKIGFSKFGELINSVANVGLEYNGAVDPFAYPAGSSITTTVPKRMWVQGWFINITYEHRTLGMRNVWAGALHSDSVAFGNDWIRVDFTNDKDTAYGQEDFRDPGYFIGATPYATTLVNGGRKTNGTAETANYEVLYDGPREFIALCRTTVYDHLVYKSDSKESDVALLQIAITIRFDKVKKCVVLYKDVKSLLVEKEGIKMKIQFSNRGEVDLGTSTGSISSYAHFYTDGKAGSLDTVAEGRNTVYDASWTLFQTEDPLDTEYPGFSAAGPYPQTVSATFDIAQAVNLAGYTWAAGFWPSLSDWSIDGWDQWWHSLTANDPHYIDYRVPSDEPFIPFYIGEWDFLLYHNLDSEGRTQFRGVTQYSLSSSYGGDDANRPGGVNVIDSEVQYYLDETFNPWDLKDAVHKNTDRWLEWKTSSSSTFKTKWSPVVVVPAAEWNDYCNFADRVISYATTAGRLLNRAAGEYTLTLNADGTATFSGLPSAKRKILYSTNPNVTIWPNEVGRYEWATVGRDAATVDSAGAALVAEAFDSYKSIGTGIAGSDLEANVAANSMPYVMAWWNTSGVISYKDSLMRAALRDDWCTYWPVASSNMLGVGGPLANSLAYYANDFTDAMYGLKDFAGTAYANKIVAVSCWNRNWPGNSFAWYPGAYANLVFPSFGMNFGYAVVSTYKDINGTVLFNVWGNEGKDTYYASLWLHGDQARGMSPGVIELQRAPKGVTSIILQINYGSDPTHPAYSIVEVLGTISETLWDDSAYAPTDVSYPWLKGGIHDP
jgi:hypothetical protein